MWDWAALWRDPAPNQQDPAVYLHTQQKGANGSIHAAKTASELIQAPLGSLHCFFRRPSWYSNDPLKFMEGQRQNRRWWVREHRVDEREEE